MQKIFLIFILLSFNLFAQNIFPKLTGKIVDNANILTIEQKNNIKNILKNHENNTSNQIVVVVIKTLDNKPIEEYALELGRYWKIGQKEKNNGVILLIAMKEHKLRIEVGYGLEGSLTDKISHEIIEYIMKPQFKKDNYYNGILLGIDNIIDAIKNEYIYEEKDNLNKENNTSFIFIFAFALIIIIEGLSSFTKNKHLKNLTKTIIFSAIAYIVSSEILQLDVLISSIISVFVFGYLFLKQLTSLKDGDINQSEIYNDKFGVNNSSSSNDIFSSSNTSIFSGSGGSFGGGGASGSW